MSLWRRILAERKAIVVPVLGGLAANVAVLLLVVLPLRANVSGDEVRAGASRMALAEAQRSERAATQTRTSKVRADEELKKFYSDVLPPNHAAARDLLYLELRTLGQQTGLEFSSSSYEPEAVDDSTLMRYRVDVSLSGDYVNMRKFLYGLETAQEFFIIENIKLGQSSRAGGGSLEVVLQVTTYYQGSTR